MILADYIFNHKQYKQVISLYKEAIDKYNSAYKLWAEHYNLPDKRNYQTKKIVANNISEIRKVDAWIKTYDDISRNKKEAILWLYNKTGKQHVSILKYNDYKFIIDNETELNLLQSYINTYNYLVQNNKEAVDRYISVASITHSYNDILKIALGKEHIIQLSSILTNAHSCEKYEYAWISFSKGRKFNDIPISDLETVSDNKFCIKDTFLKIYEQKSNLIRLILGKEMLPVDSFEEIAIAQEAKIIQLLSSSFNPIDQFDADIHLDDEDELKRAILDSEYYGHEPKFAESFNISKFYNLRNEFDNIGVSFDSAVEKIKENNNVVKAFNKERNGKSVIFIENYLAIVTEGSPLFIEVELYKSEKEKRNKAKSIKSWYARGFNALYGCIDIETCSLTIITNIINNENKILEKNREIEEQERIRAEEERKRIELNSLKGCISSWHITRYGIPHNYIFEYLKTNAPRDASQYEWDIRHLIWAFKNDPYKQDKQFTHQEALDNIIPKYESQLRQTFGSKLSLLTLVCVPASSSEKNDLRWKSFSYKICNDLNMYNGYDHIKVVQDAIPKHLGGDGNPELYFDQPFFKNKYVVLCDDVKTTGKSLIKMKLKLEALGAIVICAFTIGETVHE